MSYEKQIFIFLTIFNLISAQEYCQIQGQCQFGYQVSITTSKETYLECQRQCQNDTQCTLFTHHQNSHKCQLFSICTKLSSSQCDDCYSGERNCPIRQFGMFNLEDIHDLDSDGLVFASVLAFFVVLILCSMMQKIISNSIEICHDIWSVIF